MNIAPLVSTAADQGGSVSEGYLKELQSGTGISIF